MQVMLLDALCDVGKIALRERIGVERWYRRGGILLELALIDRHRGTPPTSGVGRYEAYACLFGAFSKSVLMK